MTDTSLLAAGAVLMQADKKSDLHPCAYFSHTFSSAQCNYNIYDHELLAVILALEEWCQYLQGTTHPVTIITNHKNLSYIKDPQKLSRQQARWSLFLQDFNLQWQVTPGTKMAPADVLSRQDHVDTTQDNQEMSICPEPIVIQALDLALAWKIWCKVAPESWGMGRSKVVSSKGLEGYEMFDPKDSRREDREEESA